MSNEEVIKLIQRADLVIDQLVIGWYAMFAIEAMSLGKPVICNLRSDFFSNSIPQLDCLIVRIVQLLMLRQIM